MNTKTMTFAAQYSLPYVDSTHQQAQDTDLNRLSIETTRPASDAERRVHGQYMTPDWAAEELIEHYFPDLTSTDKVIEPSCGEGAFLRALPSHVPLCGVEIDPALAHRAASTSGRQVIVGDFTTVDLPFRPTAIVGNPPFKLSMVLSFLDRAWELLRNDDRVGFILPCSMFQTASTVCHMNDRWGIRQDMLPRNLFRNISLPICFSVFTKGDTKRLWGFALYQEMHAVSRLKRRYKQLLDQGERNAWRAVTTAALETLGGQATIGELYREIEGVKPTENQWWKAKVRQMVQEIAVRAGRGLWRISKPSPVAA